MLPRAPPEVLVILVSMSMPTVSAASKTSQKIWQSFGCFQAVKIIKLVIINLKFSLGLQEAR